MSAASVRTSGRRANSLIDSECLELPIVSRKALHLRYDGKSRTAGPRDRLGLAHPFHVNDAGFWLVKEYFGLTVAETFKYWTTIETLLSILGLAGVLLVSLIV
jgi:hypothetical protein